MGAGCVPCLTEKFFSEILVCAIVVTDERCTADPYPRWQGGQGWGWNDTPHGNLKYSYLWKDRHPKDGVQGVERYAAVIRIYIQISMSLTLCPRWGCALIECSTLRPALQGVFSLRTQAYGCACVRGASLVPCACILFRLRRI